ncbi:MAG: FMN-binding protein [Synergistaceae bacterium]|jgi:major membrane immunogen (membrane-anchored lipoprotein)|nr:FMN-binding protein [Synergistaceae bacterium]
MKFLRLALATVIVLSAFAFPGSECCAGEMRDGYYAAEADGYDDEGWKDFITIYVSDNRIVNVEYDARNSCGFIRSWDLDYQRRAKAETGMYPGEYLRTYTDELLNRQDPFGVLVLAGAEWPHRVFQLLAGAAIAQAKIGDKSITLVDLTGIRAGNK